MFPRRYITYVEATRHPWPNFIFLLPIVILYETAVWYCTSNQIDGVRNGADGWLRQNLAVYGVNLVWLPPVFLLFFMLSRVSYGGGVGHTKMLRRSLE